MNDLSEISEDNKNDEKLNEFLKPKIKINDYNDFEKELDKWKKEISDIEKQIKTYIKIEEIDSKFLDIFSLIKSNINNLEEKEKPENNNIGKMMIPSSLSDFAVFLQSTTVKANKNYSIIANINYNEVNSNITKITEQIKSEGRIRMVVKDIQNMINKN